MILPELWLKRSTQYTKSGKPTKRWVVRVDDAMEAMLTDREVEGYSFKYTTRCAFCGRSPPWVDYHDHTQCPTLSTLNKVQENLGIKPIVAVEGVLQYTHDNKPLNVEGELKQLRATIDKLRGDLEKRLTALESDSKKSSKRKAEKPAESSSSSKKAKKEEKKEDKLKDKGKGKDNGGSGAPSSSKGKGKAAAK